MYVDVVFSLKNADWLNDLKPIFLWVIGKKHLRNPWIPEAF